MAQTRLSDASLRILKSAQLMADLPLHRIAKLTKLPIHKIQYWLNKLIQQEVIRKAVVVNPLRIGEGRYGFFFSVPPRCLCNKQKLLYFLSQHERVIWYAELGAEFQFGLSLIAKNGQEVQTFLALLERKTGVTFSRKSLSFLNEFTILEKSYLYGDKINLPRGKIQINTPDSTVEVDDIDRKILSVINQSKNHVEIMRKTGVARQTIDLRVQKLKDLKVILAEVYYINSIKLGYQSYRLLLTLADQQAGTWNALLSFCEKEPQVVNCGRCIGSWDAELTVETSKGAEASLLAEKLALSLGRQIKDVRIIPILTQKTALRTMGKPLSIIHD